MHIKRIQTLIEALKVLDDSKFNFRAFVTQYDHKNQCGTICCAAGLLPAIDKDWKWVLKDLENDVWAIRYKDAKLTPLFEQLADYFAISKSDVVNIFFETKGYFPEVEHYGHYGVYEVTRQHVIVALENLIAPKAKSCT